MYIYIYIYESSIDSISLLERVFVGGIAKLKVYANRIKPQQMNTSWHANMKKALQTDCTDRPKNDITKEDWSDLKDFNVEVIYTYQSDNFPSAEVDPQFNHELESYVQPESDNGIYESHFEKESNHNSDLSQPYESESESESKVKGKSELDDELKDWGKCKV